MMLSSINEQAFKKEVFDSPIPVVVNFWAPWCGLCRLMEPSLLRFQSEWGDQVKLVHVNADENLKLASLYRITTLPTVLILRRGQVLHRLDTFRRRDDLQIALEQVMGGLAPSKSLFIP